MKTVSLRDLRTRPDEVVMRVLAGEVLILTRAGSPVAELHPLRRPGLDRETLLKRWRQVPPIDPVAFRRDLDAVLDASPLFGFYTPTELRSASTTEKLAVFF